MELFICICFLIFYTIQDWYFSDDILNKVRLIK